MRSKVRVEDIAKKITIGPFGSRLKSDRYVPQGVPVIRGTNVTGGKEFSGDWVFVPEETADSLESCCVYAGDLVFPHRGSIGEVGLVPDDFPRYVMSSSLMKLSCDREKADPAYVYYFFKSAAGRHELLKNASQVGTPGIGQPLTSLKNIEIPLPALSEQKAIARVLSSLDEKIALNQQINKTLEQMAQAIFKSWFIDFEPVRARMAGRQPEGMGVAAALFPDELIDSEIGQIPNGWSYRKASDVVDLSIGKTPPRKEPEWFSESVNDVKWVSIRDMGSSGIYVLSTSERLTEEAVEKFNVRRVKDNTVILSFKLTVGRVAITVGEMLTNEAIAHFNVRGGAPLCSEYLYLYLLGFNYSSLGSTSSIATAVNSATIKNMPILCASESVVLAFRHVVEPFFEKIKLLEQQNTLLSDARDVLLPRLLSGELIPDFRVS